VTRATLAAALLALAVALPGAAAAADGELAARVNGAGIRRERLDRYFDERLAEAGRHVAAIRSPDAFKRLKREALDELVERELLWQEARRTKHVAPEEEVRAAMAAFREQVPDPARRRLDLERSGFTEETYAEYVQRELSIRRYVARELEPKVKVTQADIRAFYEANGDLFGEPDGRVRPEAEVREEIRAHLRAEAVRDAVAARVAALRAKAKIEVLVPLPEGASR
jgi:hypothetical protein